MKFSVANHLRHHSVTMEKQPRHQTPWNNRKLCICNFAVTWGILGQFPAFTLAAFANWYFYFGHCRLTNDLGSSLPPTALQWRHNRRDSVSNHRPHDCLRKRLFRRRSKKKSKLRVSGLSAGNKRRHTVNVSASYMGYEITNLSINGIWHAVIAFVAWYIPFGPASWSLYRKRSMPEFCKSCINVVYILFAQQDVSW